MKPITLTVVSIVFALGVLVSSIGPASMEKLPHSLKGYELYSWREDSQWHFTLITGTNRLKTIEEITSEGDVSGTGWVKIQVVGADAIKNALSKLPQGEDIMWLEGPRSEQAPPGDIEFMFPPEQIIDGVREHAEESGLNLVVLALS